MEQMDDMKDMDEGMLTVMDLTCECGRAYTLPVKGDDPLGPSGKTVWRRMGGRFVNGQPVCPACVGKMRRAKRRLEIHRQQTDLFADDVQ